MTGITKQNREREFGKHPMSYQDTKEYTCSECLEKKSKDEITTDWRKYICVECEQQLQEEGETK